MTNVLAFPTPRFLLSSKMDFIKTTELLSELLELLYARQFIVSTGKNQDFEDAIWSSKYLDTPASLKPTKSCVNKAIEEITGKPYDDFAQRYYDSPVYEAYIALMEKMREVK
jgi:hypothetical protein